VEFTEDSVRHDRMSAVISYHRMN